jgi:hypothetical protein
MGEVQGLMSLKHADVAVGQTIHWPIYNQAGQILFKSGVHIADQQQLNHLLEVGYCDANNLWDSIPSKLPSLEQLGAKTVPDTTSKPAEELNKETIVELDSVRWTVGEIFHLQTHDQAATRYTVRLIGYVKNKSLLVTAPTIDGRSASIREGQAFIIRAFPGKKPTHLPRICSNTCTCPFLICTSAIRDRCARPPSARARVQPSESSLLSRSVIRNKLLPPRWETSAWAALPV